MKIVVKKNILLPVAAAVLLLGLLAACTQQAPEPSTEPPTEPPIITVGDMEIDRDATRLELAGGFELNALLAAADELTAVTEIELGETDLRGDEMASLQAAFPDAEIRYSLNLFGRILSPDTKTLDLPDMDPARSEELAAALPLLPSLESINFVNAEGICAYTVADIPELDKIRAAAPEVFLQVSFELFGQTVTSEDTRIEYCLVEIGNDGAETVRAVLPYLQSCEYLLMDGCGVDNEVMAKLREDFPQTKVVWRVWVIRPNYNSAKLMRWGSFLTDTHRIRTVLISDATCDVLKYCVETKYVDFGHNAEISDFSFLAYMPDLEAAILALTEIDDLTPLASCPNLEYLEIFSTRVTDLSPLASCTNLEHLNISNLSGVTDISPLYGLTKLKRIRMVKSFDIPAEQMEEFARLLPDCEILSRGWDPTEHGWRYDENGNMVPRYALLYEQMEYAIDRQYGIY